MDAVRRYALQVVPLQLMCDDGANLPTQASAAVVVVTTGTAAAAAAVVAGEWIAFTAKTLAASTGAHSVGTDHNLADE